MYSAMLCDSLKNVDAIGIAIPYSAIGGVRNVGPLSSDTISLHLKDHCWGFHDQL